MPVSSPRSCPVLIERQEELATLERALAAARSGRHQLIFVEGESGSGKTRLIGDFALLSKQAGAQVMIGACSDRDRDFPFAPFVDALRQWLASAPRSQTTLLDSDHSLFSAILPELSSRPAEREGVPLPPEQEKRRLFEAICSLLARLATANAGPLLLVLEDLHWADSSSLQLIELLPRRLAVTPIVIAGSIRSGVPNHYLSRCLQTLRRARSVTELTLAPLSDSGIDRMLEAMLPTPPLPALASAIRTRADGNPFFVEEIVATLPDRIAPRWIAGTGVLPETIEEVILLQFSGLDSETAALADLAAVAGRSVSHRLLREASGLAETDLAERLDPLLERGLLVASFEPGEHRYAFRHALTHDVLRAQLPPSARRALHERVSAALERSAPVDALITPELAGEIGFHAHAAADWDKALIYATLAGDAAWRVRAVVESLRHDRRALDAAIALRSNREPELHRRCGTALTLLGALEPAQTELEIALAQARARGLIEVEQATLADLAAFFASRDYATAKHHAEASLALARQINDPVRIGRALNRLGNVLTNQLQFEEGRALHDEALAIFKQRGDHWGSADCLDLIGMARYLAGDVMEARDAFERAAAIFAELGDYERVASALTSRGLYLAVIDGACATSDGPEHYRTDAAEGLRLARELSWRAGEAYALVALACADLGNGRFGDARRQAELALRIVEDLDHHQWKIISLFTLGLIDASELATDYARDRFDAALLLARAAGADQWAERLEAWITALQPDAEQADLPFSAARPASIGQRRRLISAIERALSDGRYADANQGAERLLRGATGPRPPEVLRLHAEALAGLGRFDEADAVFLEARRMVDAAGPHCQRWRISMGRAQLWEERDPAIAMAESALARSDILQLADSEPDEKRREVFLHNPAFRNVVAPSGRRRTRDSVAPGGLTQREQEVAQCIAAGMSNKVIAHNLSISEKTVEMHVSSSLGKFGFSSRAQLAAWVARGGIATRDDTGTERTPSQGFP